MSGPRVLAGVESDEELIASARDGDRAAFAELWQRHARSGLTVARHFTSSLDADDLVAEAFTSIYQRVLAGGGPDGAFRPYLYTTIRNLARKWGSSARDVAVDDIGDVADPNVIDDPVVALDRSLTARAFRALPERWQAVLWYTEVEGMDPQEVAPLLGISANGVAALAYRAREGLRKSWLQAHVSDISASGSCRWTIERLGDRARHGLTKREHARVHEHLGTCAKCSMIAEEVDEVGSRIAVIVVPLVLGGGVGGGFLSTLFGNSGAAMASELAVPAPFVVTGAASTSVAVTAVAAPAAVFGGLVVAAALTAAVAVGIVSSQGPAADQAVASTSVVSGDADELTDPLPIDTAGAAIDSLLPGVSTTLDETLGSISDPVGFLTSAVDTALPAPPVTPSVTVPIQPPPPVTAADIVPLDSPLETLPNGIGDTIGATVELLP